MDHYRVNKLATPGGMIVKTKDVLAASDSQAIRDAHQDEDCPVCEVWRAGQKIGSVTE
jgi:hypothetical protein